VFRLAAGLHLFKWAIDRQRLVNTFLTNMRGPTTPLTIGGARVVRIVPVTITAGNVTVAFAVLSYAGTLGITVIIDPDAFPELDLLVEALHGELAAIAATSRAT
jgi:diacylglycerol O-acyltransferase